MVWVTKPEEARKPLSALIDTEMNFQLLALFIHTSGDQPESVFCSIQ